MTICRFPQACYQHDMPQSLSPTARILGLLGLLPQAAALALILLDDPATRFTALSFAFAYAALILSFLGGLWWGLAAAAPLPPRWIWFAAVTPSLFALASCIPWAIGGAWPGPSLVLLGLALIGSLTVDRRLVALAVAPAWWMKLRWPLSVGLGALSVLLGFMAF
jgi:Protein of unknown function (DUF3429)